jgi:hypothetical protein
VRLHGNPLEMVPTLRKFFGTDRTTRTNEESADETRWLRRGPHSDVDMRRNLWRLWRSNGQFAAVVPFIMIFALLVGISLWELRIEDGSRIFLGGENLWDGGQKRAILCP